LQIPSQHVSITAKKIAGSSNIPLTQVVGAITTHGFGKIAGNSASAIVQEMEETDL